jgi:alanyl-tRNA synthetase
VPTARRLDTERNHTATHLLHAALRGVLGEHVHQAGSVVEPDRLRFDFTHHGPLRTEQLEQVERWVNDAIWRSVDVRFSEQSYAAAVAKGAMALFGEKYGSVVRVVEIPELSIELCGGTHVKNTGHIGLFRIVSESGVSAGVRRIVAATGPRAFELMRERERTLEALGERLKVNVHAVTPDVIEKKLDALLGEKRALEHKLEDALKGGGGSAVQALMAGAQRVGKHTIVSGTVQAADAKDLQSVGDGVREGIGSGVGVIGAAFEDGKATLLVVVSDALRERGVSAGDLVKEFARQTGSRGGGKPHMAQAGLAPDALDGALETATAIARAALEKAT